MQRKVVFDQGTEPPFDNKYRDHKEEGIYVDIIDGTPLFSSTDKFDSGTGRPSFTTPIDELLIELKEDRKFGMLRTEVETKNDTHLGHVFND
jgi:methionine-R-sulfoxide reductase